MFDESQMVRRVRAYLASVKSSIVTDEALLSEKSAHCEPPAVLPPQQPGSFCPALVSLHWLRVPERISFKVAVLIIHAVPPRPTYSRVWPVLPTWWWHPDDGCGLLPHIIRTFRPFVSLQSASGRFRFLVPPSGMTCPSTSHLRRHSRFSDNESRPFCCPIPTKTLSYDSCVTITIHHYCLDTCGPCNN